MAGGRSPRVTTVHVIPHSHTDPGWLNTFQHYYGGEVKTIIDSVVRALEASPNRTFVWAETCFFQKWFDEQSAHRRGIVRALVRNRQLEFVGGGWVQHDEALPTVGAMLEQMAEGHLWLNATFNVWPKIGWQLDPFGHTATSAALLSRMGFRALVINRIHYKLKRHFQNSRHLEFHWQGAAPRLGMGSLLTHVLHTHYSTPRGLDFEATSGMRLDYRIKADLFQQVVRERGTAYRTSHMMLLVGDDFRWRKAEDMYRGWEKLAAVLNQSHAKVNLIFSTPERYFAALQASRPALPTFAGDLVPYADNGESFWTGFYSTKPELKDHVRRTSAAVDAAHSIYVLARAAGTHPATPDVGHAGGGGSNQTVVRRRLASWYDALELSRRAVAILQHHDAITGTSRANVVEDYERMLRDAKGRALHVAAQAATLLLSRQGEEREPQSAAEGSAAEGSATFNLTERIGTLGAIPLGKQHTLVFFNTLPFRRCEPVTFRAISPNLTLSDGEGRRQPLGVAIASAPPSPPPPSPGDGRRRRGAAKGAEAKPHRVWFEACVPALGFATFVLRHTDQAPPTVTTAAPKYWTGKAAPPTTTTLHGECVDAMIDGSSGMLSRADLRPCDGASVAPLAAAVAAKAKLELLAYKTQKSGAYIMRTLRQEASPLYGEHEVAASESELHRTPAHEEFVRRAGPAYTVVTRVHRGGGAESPAAADPRSRHIVEVEIHLLAPRNLEIILRLHAGIDGRPADDFYTHDGLHWRQRGAPPGEEAAPSPAAAFFPTSVGAALTWDGGSGREARQLSMICDRSTGVARVARTATDGGSGFEILLHRSLAQDDGRGLFGPAFDDNEARIKCYLVWSDAPRATAVDALVMRVMAPLLPLRVACAAAAEAAGSSAAHSPACGASSARALPASSSAARDTGGSSWPCVTNGGGGGAGAGCVRPLIVWARSMENTSRRVLLRVQRSCVDDCGGDAAWLAVQRLLGPPFALTTMREVGLTGGALAPAFGSTSLAGEATTDEVGGGNPRTHEDNEGPRLAASQNSNEQGVFLSDAALSERGGGGAARSPRRRLLSGGGVTPSRRRADATPPLEHFGPTALEVRAFECDLIYGVTTAPPLQAPPHLLQPSPMADSARPVATTTPLHALPATLDAALGVPRATTDVAARTVRPHRDHGVERRADVTPTVWLPTVAAVASLLMLLCRLNRVRAPFARVRR